MIGVRPVFAIPTVSFVLAIVVGIVFNSFWGGVAAYIIFNMLIIGVWMKISIANPITGYRDLKSGEAKRK